MRNLSIENNANRHTASFRFCLSNRPSSTRQGYLFRDGATIYVMQGASVIASSYTPEEIAERNRLNTEAPIREGDKVVVDGVTYSVGRLGDYSDAGKLVPVVG